MQLVNNEVFPSSLNIDLTHMFLDLKDGAKIVSLKPFVPEGFRMNDSNVSQSSVQLTQGSVSGTLTDSATHLLRSSNWRVTIMPKDG
jgi:hypothetical protein